MHCWSCTDGTPSIPLYHPHTSSTVSHMLWKKQWSGASLQQHMKGMIKYLASCVHSHCLIKITCFHKIPQLYYLLNSSKILTTKLFPWPTLVSPCIGISLPGCVYVKSQGRICCTKLLSSLGNCNYFVAITYWCFTLVTDPSRLPASIPSLCNHVLLFPIHLVAQIPTSFWNWCMKILQGVTAWDMRGACKHLGAITSSARTRVSIPSFPCILFNIGHYKENFQGPSLLCNICSTLLKQAAITNKKRF